MDPRPDLPAAGPPWGRRFFRAVFVLYALFVAACVCLVFIDPPWRPSGGNIGAGWLGFFAAGAAGLPWNLAMFPLSTTCERLSITSSCDAMMGGSFFYVLSALGCVLNCWLLGALARWWSVPWRKTPATDQQKG